MNQIPLVTVIVPTMNSARTLEECLASVRAQTHLRIEVLVVDNPKSTDATRAIAARYADQVVVQGPERCSQRNEGARLAKGEFVAFIDSDMTLAPEVIAQCVAQMAADVQGVIMPEESFGEGFWAQCKKLERSFYEGIDWMEAARFFRRETFRGIGGYDEKLVSGEDWDLSQRMRGRGSLARIQARIRHDEGRLTLRQTVGKKWYYAKEFAKYAAKDEHAAETRKQTGVIGRYGLFFAKPRVLFARPLVGLGMLFMKTCEFLAGGLALAWSTLTSHD